ncbi:phosphatase PAP2 family protein [Rhodanobacter sp. C03]|uniref:phosphatase PAP2 family protein n=1 Tax=Rhodanobacter sp. C03 TaxID=1945858 RepID=UPI000987386C|nr:phosphatase PAP2 family protein [Rhodanobacter sp. C03]OOG56742.1 phosphoesterase PA-phosphatase [Rhodanobacter sp. C03]
MNTLVDWIAVHALPLWVMLPLLAVLSGDLIGQRSAHRRMIAMADGRQPDVMQSRTVATLGTLAALLFAVIAFAIGTSEPGALVRFDTALAADIHVRLPPSALPVLATVSLLGSTPWVVTASMLMLLTLLLRRQWNLAVCWAIAQIGILPIAYGIKACFQRTRPPHDPRFVTDVGWSFPSGHAISSAVFYGMLAYVLLRLLPPRWHRMVIAATLLLAGLIGLSRILLQAHYFSDVVAGYACGLAWLMLCIGLAERLRRRDMMRSPAGKSFR